MEEEEVLKTIEQRKNHLQCSLSRSVHVRVHDDHDVHDGRDESELVKQAGCQ